MKKILFLLTAAIFLSVASNAQTWFQGNIADSSLTNAQTASFTKVITGAKTNVTFQYGITNTSGTTAATIVLYGSNDGTIYSQIASDAVSATSTFAHAYNFNGYAKYKVTITQTGTSVTNYKVLVLYR